MNNQETLSAEQGADSGAAHGSADSAQYCGRWVFKRPITRDGEILTYLVRTPDGHIMQDRGYGQANSFGEIFAWLEMYPEPPYPPNG